MAFPGVLRIVAVLCIVVAPFQEVSAVQSKLDVVTSHVNSAADKGVIVDEKVAPQDKINDGAAAGARHDNEDTGGDIALRWNVSPHRRYKQHHHRNSMVSASSPQPQARQASFIAVATSNSADTLSVVLLVVLIVLGIPAVIIAVLALVILCNSAAMRFFGALSTLVPIMIAYKRKLRSFPASMTEEERTEALEELHQKYAPQLREFITRRKGIAVKSAQFMATQHLVPKTYRDELAKCQDSCVPMDFKDVERIMTTSLSRPLKDVFSSFGEEPIAVASIGQVHKARLRKEDVDVAVKVKLVGVHAAFAEDRRIVNSCIAIINCLKLTPFDLTILAEGIFAMVQKELDYEQEVRNTEIMRKVLVPHFGKSVEVAECYTDCCTRDVITMGFISGIKVDRVAMESLRGMGLKLKGASHLLGDGGEEGAEGGADGGAGGAGSGANQPVDRLGCLGNVCVKTNVCMGDSAIDAALGVLRTRARLRRRCNTLCGGCLGCSPTRRGTTELAKIAAKVNAKQLVDRLWEIWGYCVFEAGCFNCDPHPGNVLVQESGRLGLLDYGQIKVLTVDWRKRFARFLLAVANGDRATCEQAIRDLGWRVVWNTNVTPKAGSSCEWEWAKVAMGSPLPATDTLLVDIDETFVPVGRAMLILKGLSLCLGYGAAIAKRWKGNCQRFLQLHDA